MHSPTTRLKHAAQSVALAEALVPGFPSKTGIVCTHDFAALCQELLFESCAVRQKMGSPLADYQGFTQFRVVEQRFLFEAKVQRSDWDGGERLSQCQDGQRTADQGLENATIVRSTQFFEFVPGIAQAATIGQTLRQLPADLQSIRSDDVADAAADATLCPAVNGMIEIAGPERIPLDERAWRYLRAIKDARQVVADAHARYFGAELNDQSLTPTARRASRIGSAARWRSDNPLPPKAGVLGGRIGANPQTQVSVRETYNE